MRRKLQSFFVCFLLVLTIFTVVNVFFDIVLRVESPSFTIYVDDDAPNDPGPNDPSVSDPLEDGSSSHPFDMIQEGVDYAWSGDTVYVYSGIYHEYVIVDRDMSLIGENRDTTLIDCRSPLGSGITITASYVTVTGFKIFGPGSSGSGENWAAIYLDQSGYNNIYNNNLIGGGDSGIYLNYATGNVIQNNIISGYLEDIFLSHSNGNTITANTLSNNNNNYGILLDNSNGNVIATNTVSNCWTGIYFWDNSNGNIITNNAISNNDNGMYFFTSNGNTVFDNIILSNINGVKFVDSVNNLLINCTISSSVNYDFYFSSLSSYSHGISINTTFDKSKTYFENTPDSLLTVKWYVHVYVTDYLGYPVPSAIVEIEDNINGSYNKLFTTDVDGYVGWIPVSEYIEQDSDDDTIGEKTYYTPHRIIAWNDTLVGFAYPDPIIDESKTINIVLYNGTMLDLEPGWNLISLPRPQMDTNIQIVLQPIEGRYDVVQWYNETDIKDHWEHYYVSKPSSMNDLHDLNHKLGFWLHILDPQGTTLVVFGNEPTINQSIMLRSGWNLVSYPSLSNKNRTEALNNITFDTHVDSIWAFNATTQKWKEIEISDKFIVGKGYWIHSKVTKIWNVPL